MTRDHKAGTILTFAMGAAAGAVAALLLAPKTGENYGAILPPGQRWSQSGPRHWQRFKAENTENRSSSARPSTGCDGGGTRSIQPSEAGLSFANQPGKLPN